jgi:hypothetical protein
MQATKGAWERILLGYNPHGFWVCKIFDDLAKTTLAIVQGEPLQSRPEADS